MLLSPRKRSVLTAAIFAWLAACGGDNGAIAYEAGGAVHWAELDAVPPGDAIQTRQVLSISGLNVEDISLNPGDGVLLAATTTDRTSPGDGILDGRLRVYDTAGPTILQDWDEDGLQGLIENNSSISYPSGLHDFNAFDVAWMDSTALLVHIQPIIVGTEFETIPPNVALVVSVRSGAVTQGPSQYPRSGTSPIVAPDHSSKTRYTVENRSGTIFIDGQQVNGLPTDIEAADFVFTGN